MSSQKQWLQGMSWVLAKWEIMICSYWHHPTVHVQSGDMVARIIWGGGNMEIPNFFGIMCELLVHEE
jgi:hypothetical protein